MNIPYFVDFKYELITNATRVNMTGISIPAIVRKVETAVTNLLLGILFSACTSPKYRALSGIKEIEIDGRSLLSSPEVIGISSLPADYISYGENINFTMHSLLMHPHLILFSSFQKNVIQFNFPVLLDVL